MAVIPYGDVLDVRYLPVDAQDVVTRVRLVIAGDQAGASTQGPRITHAVGSWSNASADLEDLSYFPDPVVYEYTAPEHATYGATRAMALPSGANPFLHPNDPRIPEPAVLRFTNPGLPSAVRDGDPETYAEFSGGDGETGWITYLPDPSITPVGMRLRYSLSVTSNTAERGVHVGIYHTVHAQPPLDDSDWFSGYTFVDRLRDAEMAELYAVVPPDARWRPENAPFPLEAPEVSIQLYVPSQAVLSYMNVHAFYPLVLDEAYLEEVARAQIRIPAQTPTRVTARGVISPDRTHTITGWPGGDYTGQVAQHQYDVGRTIIDFEQAGAPAGLPAEAIEAARERRATIDTSISIANYNLMMGSRR